MAKAKSPPELAAPAGPHRPSQYQLAAGVAKHVELRNVLLRSMAAALKMRLSEASEVIESGKTDASVRVSPAHTFNEESLELVVVIGFSISVSTGEPSKDLLTVDAEFELTYGLDGPPPKLHRDMLLSAFAHINGTYNAWPYLRELVQATTARMTLPPVVLPVFRVTPDARASGDTEKPTGKKGRPNA